MKTVKSKETYTKNGVTTTKWFEVGVIFEANGKEYLKLNALPNVVYHVFAITEKPQPTVMVPNAEEKLEEEFIAGL